LSFDLNHFKVRLIHFISEKMTYPKFGFFETWRDLTRLNYLLQNLYTWKKVGFCVPLLVP